MKSERWDKQRTLILLALANGLSRAAAAARAGVTYRTYARWVAAEPDFEEAVELAMGTGRAMLEELLVRHGKKDWRAALAAYEIVYLGDSESAVARTSTSLSRTSSALPCPCPRTSWRLSGARYWPSSKTRTAATRRRWRICWSTGRCGRLVRVRRRPEQRVLADTRATDSSAGYLCAI